MSTEPPLNAVAAARIGYRAAFHGAPEPAVPILQSLADEDSEVRWLLGVCQAAAGLFGSALENLAPLLRQQGPFTAPGHCVAASVYRQIGDFIAAEHHDQVAATTNVSAVRCDALIGLTADAVGVGDLPLARARLAAATSAWQPHWWREGIRLAWVHAETELLGEQISEAPAVLQRALLTARVHRAPRHEAKTAAFLAVMTRIRDEAGGRQLARQLLDSAAQQAQSLSLRPLIWVICGVQWQWLWESPADPVAAAKARAAATAAATAIAADLPDALRMTFAQRADVAVLRD